MAKYQNLDWNATEKLKKLYEKANPKPAEPAPYQEPMVTPSNLIRADGENRVYVEGSNATNGKRGRLSSSNTEYECQVRIVVVTGGENIKVEIATEELEFLIAELQRKAEEIKAVNDARLAERQAQKQHRESMQAWDETRDSHLEKKLAKGNITAQKIMEAETIRDLWLD